MNKSLFFLALLSVNSIQTEPQKLRCGSAEHCYRLLKRDVFKSLLSPVDKLFEEKIDKQSSSSTSSGTVDLSNELRSTTEQLIDNMFDFRDGSEWMKLIKETQTMTFDVDEFECGDVIEKALKDNDAYPAIVNKWLESFDPRNLEGLMAGIDALVDLQRALRDYDQTANNIRRRCQTILDQLRVSITSIDDALTKQRTKALNAIEEIKTIDLMAEEISQIVKTSLKVTRTLSEPAAKSLAHLVRGAKVLAIAEIVYHVLPQIATRKVAIVHAIRATAQILNLAMFHLERFDMYIWRFESMHIS